MYKIFLFTAVLNFAYFVSNAQALSYTDPAQAYNRLLLDQHGEGGSYDRVGAFKVKGNPNLFGGVLEGKIHLKNNTFMNSAVKLSYNTYNQQITVYNAANEPIATVGSNDVDSFTLKVNIPDYFGELFFVSARIVGAKEQGFYCVLQQNKFSLYKKYFCQLAIPSENILQSDLRTYDLGYDYYYAGYADKPGMNKIKPSANFLTKEFKKIKDYSYALNNDALTYNTEQALQLFFIELNK